MIYLFFLFFSGTVGDETDFAQLLTTLQNVKEYTIAAANLTEHIRTATEIKKIDSLVDHLRRIIDSIFGENAEKRKTYLHILLQHGKEKMNRWGPLKLFENQGAECSNQIETSIWSKGTQKGGVHAQNSLSQLLTKRWYGNYRSICNLDNIDARSSQTVGNWVEIFIKRYT